MGDTIFKIAKLKGSSNYDIWSIRIESILIKDNLDSYININYLDQIGIEGLEEQAKKATSLIKLSLEDSPLLQTKTIDNPYLLWDNLKTLYSSKGFTSEFLLSKELINTTLDYYKGNLESYTNNFKRVINNLEAKDIKLPRKFIIALLLNNLNGNYEQIVAIITQSIRTDNTSSITLEEIIAQLLDEFRRLNSIYKPSYNSNKAKSTSYYNSNSSSSNSKEEKTLNSKGPTKSYNNSKKDTTICNFCKKKGHEENSCWSKNSKKDNITLSTTILSTNTSSSNYITTEFVLDSGATVHICYIKELFNFIKPTRTYIRWGNKDSSIIATGIGNIDIYLENTLVTITNVLFIPEFNVNLLSVSLITAKGYTLSFTKNKCIVYTPSKDILAKGYNYKGTTTIKAFSKFSKKIINSTVEEDSNSLDLVDPNLEESIDNNLKVIDLDPSSSRSSFLDTSSNTSTNNNSTIESSSTIDVDNNLESIVEPTKDPVTSSTKEILKYNNNSVELIHNRLGHPNLQAIKSLENNTTGFNINPKDYNNAKVSLNNCTTCIQAKLTKSISKKPSTKVDNYLDLIYLDIGRPITPKTFRGFKYYIAFKDSYSKYLEVKLLKSRENIVNTIKDTMEMLELEAYNNSPNSSITNSNFNSNRLKSIQFDNEFTSKELTSYLNSKGIKIRLTSPYSSKRNGAVEIINRTLLNKVRALLINSNLPKELWGEAILASTYYYNRTPNSSIDFKTPYYLKYLKLPNISNIKIFRSLTYYKEPLVKKLDSRSTPYYLIGYRGDNSVVE
jgi:hypothetical protein